MATPTGGGSTFESSTFLYLMVAAGAEGLTLEESPPLCFAIMAWITLSLTPDCFNFTKPSADVSNSAGAAPRTAAVTVDSSSPAFVILMTSALLTAQALSALRLKPKAQMIRMDVFML